MIETVFAKILEISLLSSVMMLPLLITRAVWKTIPRRLLAVLWGMVGIRLLLPFSFETEVLVLSAPKQPIPSAVNDVAGSVCAGSGASIMPLAFAIWLCGVAAGVLYIPDFNVK